MSLIYIGKKVPKGLREVGPAMHLGGGVWAFSVEPVPAPFPMTTTYTAGNPNGVTFTLSRGKTKRRKRKGAR